MPLTVTLSGSPQELLELAALVAPRGADAPSPKLDQILASLSSLTQQGTFIMSAIDDIRADVAAQKSVNASAITLLTGLHDQLAAALAKPNADDVVAAVQAVADDLKPSTDALAAAVAANTPAAPIATATEPAPAADPSTGATLSSQS